MVYRREDIVGNLAILELQRAEEEIVRQVQKATFRKVFEAFSNISPGASERLMKMESRPLDLQIGSKVKKWVAVCW